jgi:hypothetical protein
MCSRVSSILPVPKVSVASDSATVLAVDFPTPKLHTRGGEGEILAVFPSALSL